MELAFKALIFILLALILASLGSGMFFLTRDKGDKNRTVTALTIRIVLSLCLFFVLIFGYYAGLIQPHGITP